MMNPFICGKVVSGTGVHRLFSLTADEWTWRYYDDGEREWSLVAKGEGLYQAVRYFRDAQGVWQELSFGRVPRMPVPVVERELIDRLKKARAFA